MRGKEGDLGSGFSGFFFFNRINIIIFLMYKIFFSTWQPHQHKCAATSSFNRPMDEKSNGGIILK